MTNQPADRKTFRSISPTDYGNLDPNTKDEVVRTRHLGIVRNCEKLIESELINTLTKPRIGSDGSTLPPLKHEDIVVVLMHREDPITPQAMRDSWEQQNIEVGVFIAADRLLFAEAMAIWTPEPVAGQPPSNKRPYRNVGRVLLQAPPPGCVYIAVYDTGMCTVTFVAFDPANPNAEYINADPNVKPPPAVAPLPLAEPKESPQIAAETQPAGDGSGT